LNEFLHTKMDELIAKYLLQEATDAEVVEVERWVAENEANQKQFDHFMFLWVESKKIAAKSVADEDMAWQRFKTKLQAPKATAIVVPINNRFKWLKIAAAVVTVIIGGWFIQNRFTKGDTNKLILVQTQKNIVIDTLPDNSIVTLNKNSSIEYNSKFINGNERNIKLKGEAFFNVTPDKNKPFIITVNDVEVKVVGTSFNIKTINGQTEVIVKTGIVQVAKNGKAVTLASQEKLLTKQNETDLVKESTADKLFDYYQTKEFVCDDTPLWRLVEVLNEAYDANVVIGRKELRNMKITTTFVDAPLDTVLQIIATTFQLNITHKEGQIILQ
jgi:transmembrane sensor